MQRALMPTVVAALLASCGGGQVEHIGKLTDADAGFWPDLVRLQDTLADAGAEGSGDDFRLPEAAELPPRADVPPAPGEPGAACDSGADCYSGFCIATPDGQKCTSECEEECPFGWQCVLHLTSLPDQIYICAPAHMSLCRPCHTNTDCWANGVDAGQVCVRYGGGENFCGGACEGDSSCPAGYECLESEDVTGALSFQCVTEAEECACAQWFIDEAASTSCRMENEFGQCPGERLCTAEGLSECDAKTPGAEECNGGDDDCDGEVDEEQGETTCGLGICLHTVQNCASGLPQVCDEMEGVELEECDGKDNNCDGEVDEAYPDTDGDGVADCLETDADNDGIPDNADNCFGVKNPGQEDFDLDTVGDACDPDDDDDKVADADDCAPFDDGVFPGADELCNGFDDNCNLLVDESFPDTDADKVADCLDEDDDGDDYVDDVDCAPQDPYIYPGAPEACDGKDNNCDGQVDEGHPDTDGDGVADCLETDADDDGVPDSADNCVGVKNPGQENLDGDALGDACDDDIDGDGVPNVLDNCPIFNPTQEDLDGDGEGDVCDEDGDGDEVVDSADNCVGVENPGQEDNDGDGEGDACDVDDDGDGVEDVADNCPLTPNPEQEDSDGDLVGDACEDDVDGDKVPDGQDNCPTDYNPEQEDCDGDGVGDACQADDDGDGAPDEEDNCACLANPGQENLDGDELGDQCDPDLDGDGVANGLDNCPELFNPSLQDTDGDGEGDACDDDDDGDGVADSADNCVGVKNPGQEDTDGDGEGDACDDDDDGDGDPDLTDCAPLDPSVHVWADEECDGVDNNCSLVVDEGFNDSDLDGFKDCVDMDDDNDGDPDLSDCAPFDPDIHAGAGEKCNGVDDNCNGLVDEVLGNSECGLGECSHVVQNCVDGVPQWCNPFEGAGAEVCDGLDNNCDGVADDALGSTTCGLGVCTHTVNNCVGGEPKDCEPMDGSELEKCDSLDNDCDGPVDEDLGVTTCGLGVCTHTVDNCAGGTPQVCDAWEGVGVEECDGLDNDCDGDVDEEMGTVTCGIGPCEHTVDNCVGGTPQACDPMEGFDLEECDGLDNDCDGEIDEVCGCEMVEISVQEVSGADVAAYQVKLELGPDSITWSLVNGNGKDVGFFDAQDNQLPHWFEQFNKGGQTAVVWVRVESLPAGGAKTIYMYYGGAGVSYDQDPDAVFVFFDDFEDGSWNAKWKKSNSSVNAQENSGWLKLRPVPSGDYGCLVADTALTPAANGYAFAHRSRRVDGSCEGHGLYLFHNDSYNGPTYSHDGKGNDPQSGYRFFVGQSMHCSGLSGLQGSVWAGSNWSNVAETSLSSYNDDNWHRYEVVYDAVTDTFTSGAAGFLDTVTVTDSQYAGALFSLGAHDEDAYADFEWVLVRDYITAEPTASLSQPAVLCQ